VYRLQVLANNVAKGENTNVAFFWTVIPLSRICVHLLRGPRIASLAREMVPKLLKLFLIAKCQTGISTLLCDFVSHSAESISEIVFANETLLEEAIGEYRFPVAFGHFDSALTDFHRVVELCLKDNADVLEWIARLRENVDWRFLLPKCRDLLPGLSRLCLPPSFARSEFSFPVTPIR
jgi:hypothetical protein